MSWKGLWALHRPLMGRAHRPATLAPRFALLRRIAALVLPEYRFKWPEIDWWSDPEFTAYLERFNELRGANSDRRYAVSQLTRLADAVEGDTAEVGAYTGAMSWLICAANGRSKMHHIFDSFEGLSQPEAVDGSFWQVGALACGEETVQRNLEDHAGHFRTYKGWVPARFHEVANRRFSFVHIDVDLYQPTRDSLEFFYPRLNPGGILVCDDWGFATCPGATKACDEFLAGKPEKMVGLAAGAGFIIKGTATAAK